MPQVKVLRSRGVNLVVSAYGELLFTPQGPVAQWNRKISRRLKTLTTQFAPSNSRPRWAHYGPPLKRTFRATTDSDPATMRAHTAVGSTAHYAAYVDQGTGVYAGGSPYEAVLLPPWLPHYRYYEKAPWRKARLVRGQEGQEFFDAGLRAALRSVGLTTVETPGEPPGNALRTFPDHLLGFLGNTPWSLAFDAQRNQWRKEWAEWWQDERMRRARETSSRRWREWDRKYAPTLERKRELAAARQAKWRRNNPEKNKAARLKQNEQRKALRKPQGGRSGESALSRAQKMAKREMALWLMRHPGGRILRWNSLGFLGVWGTGQQDTIYWSMATADMFAEAGAQHETAPKRR